MVAVAYNVGRHLKTGNDAAFSRSVTVTGLAGVGMVITWCRRGLGSFLDLVCGPETSELNRIAAARSSA